MEGPSSRREGWNWRWTAVGFDAGEGGRRKNQRKPIVRREEKMVVMSEFALAFGFIMCQERREEIRANGEGKLVGTGGPLLMCVEYNRLALLLVVRPLFYSRMRIAEYP
jgi:hypothetical protein